MKTNKRNIVILGSGFGGLKCARKLARLIRGSPGFSIDHRHTHRVILIDKNDYQIYTPSLYDVAATTHEDAESLELKKISTLPIEEAVAGEEITFIQAEVTVINIDSRYLHFKDRDPLEFEYAVLAIGSETDFFGIEGLEHYALPLKTFKDAIKIRGHLTTIFQKGYETTRIVVAGAGPTGVEFSGELAHSIRRGHWKKYLKGGIEISLVEGRETILFGFHPKTIRLAQTRLKKLGVNILDLSFISKVDERNIYFKSGETFPYHILVWTGGVKPANITQELNLRIEKSGRLDVDPELTCALANPLLGIAENIYAIGDIVCFRDPKTGRPLPGMARVAMSQADIVAKNIAADIKQAKTRVAYQPHEWPYLIPLGGKNVIAKVGPLVFAGFLGWILKMLVELNYLVSVLPLWLAIRKWIKSVWVLSKND